MNTCPVCAGPKSRKSQHCHKCSYGARHHAYTVPAEIGAEYIHRCISKAGSEKELARQLGMNPRRIREWKGGKRMMLTTFDKVCCAMGHHPAEIWEGW